MKGQLLMNVAQSGNTAAIEQASAAFKYATSLSPDRQQIAYSWAHLLLMKNDVKGATDLLEAANAKEPGIGIGHWYLALIYIDSDTMRAASEIDLASKNGHNIAAPENRLLAGLVYKRAGQLQKAAELFVLAINDSATRNWNAELVLAADGTFAELNLLDDQKKLREQFSDVFKTKNKT
jgi:tetratricopeptide (TPR) repeat protein